nr:flagellar FliJ family protein [uncultured Tolumonas sp.]
MLKHYLTLQQKQLDQLGQTMHAQQQKLRQEQQRQQQLEHYRDTLAQGLDLRNPLIRENCDGMRQQLQRLVSGQQQLVSQTHSELQQNQLEFRQHYSKVKGLERLQQNKELQQLQRADRRQQTMLDDLSSHRFAHPHR